MPSYKLTYFDLRARGEPIRMLFALVGLPLEDVRISNDDWPTLKSTFPHGVLPVLEIDGEQLSQTLAILRYIANEHGFAGKNNLEKAKVDSISDLYSDFLNAICPWHIVQAGYVAGDKDKLYKEMFEPARERFFTILEKELKKSTSGWLVGDSLTFADLYIAACMEMYVALLKDSKILFDGFPAIEDHMNKVFSHPGLKKYLENRPDARY